MSVFLLLVPFAANDAHAQRQKPLNQAVVDGDIDEVKSQISAGADVNSKDARTGWTLLHIAIRKQRTEIAQFLIDKGADVNARDNRGRMPLHFAAEVGQKEIVEKLIAKGAEINVMDGQADNALSLARKNNHKEVVDLLTKHGAQEPNPQDLFGDRLYPSSARPGGTNPNVNYTRPVQTSSNTGNVDQSSVIANILADPNEIKARVKQDMITERLF